MCYVNPHSGRLSNHWISLHEHGHVAGFVPLLVMDVWEHAYLLDYKPSERASYIDAFFANIDWKSSGEAATALRAGIDGKRPEDDRNSLGRLMIDTIETGAIPDRRKS